MGSKKRRPSSSSGGGGGSRLFAAVSALDSADDRASRTRRAESESAASRSRAARAQSDLGAGLVECRVLLQRAVTAAATTTTATAEGGDDEGGSSAKKRRLNDDGAASASADRLLAKLLEARNRLCLPRDEGGSDPDYAALVSNDDGSSVDGDASSSEDGDESDSDGGPGAGAGGGKLERALRSEYDLCRSSWRETLDRRHADLRLHAGLTARTKFRAVDRSFWEQVESTVAHDRLMRGAGGSAEKGGEGVEGGGDGGGAAGLPIFDDSKVYRQLLRDFVALGAGGDGGGGAGGGGRSGLAAEAAAERLRRAARKKKSGNGADDVDRKASKGRKIRYAVHAKLTNFTFPVARPLPAISDDDWFKSLFGGASAAGGAGGGGRRRKSRG